MVITPCFRTWQDSTVIARIRKGRHLVTFCTQVLCSWVTEYLGISRSHAGRRQWQPLEDPHGQRSLVGCGPWGRGETDTTGRPHFHFSLSCIGEGHGSPLQSSCLENPRDGRAWWAAAYGVAQSPTRLKWLSSSRNHAEGSEEKLKDVPKRRINWKC